MSSRASHGHDGPQICEGVVMHARLRPVQHQFVYPVAFCLLPLHQLETCQRRFFGINRWNLLSIHERDYGKRDGSSLIPWLTDLYLQKIQGNATFNQKASQNKVFSEVWLQTFPRVLGYVFNPVSFWYGYDADGKLLAILAEVSNTFGERHNYLLAHTDGSTIEDGEWFERDKVFHVSPFFPVRGHYRFQFKLEDGKPRARIDYGDAAGDLLRTAISGTPAALTGRRALSTFIRYPMLTIGVVARIHWQAALLYFGKRVQFFKKPAPPTEETSS